MEIKQLDKYTIISTNIGKYLVPKNFPDGVKEENMGKPVRIIFDNTGIIPEFEEREV